MTDDLLSTISADAHVSLYIHFPFCLKKCHYCSFTSYDDKEYLMDEYVTALVREMRICRERLPASVVASTLYLGGGTPSLMTPTQVGRIVDAAELFNLAADAEITIEANPGTISRAKLANYRDLGVNRLSLGVQSFQDDLLQKMGRVHDAGQAREAFAAARSSGFTNVGIDLIHALPEQTPAMWENDLHMAIALRPEHISVYGLTVEEGTKFAECAEKGALVLPDEESAARMTEKAAEMLRSYGYEHYEIANFACPGRRSRHNQVYWQRGNYLGFGAGAHSFLRETAWGVRWSNPDDVTEYLALVRERSASRREKHILSRRDAMAEKLFLGLRLLDGIDLSEFRTEFGVECEEIYGEACSLLLSQGFLEIHAGRLKLADKSLLIANQIFMKFL